MRVKLLSTMAGPKGCHLSGDVVELSSASAKEMIEGGFAVALDVPEVPVSPAVDEPEEAETKPIKKGK